MAQEKTKMQDKGQATERPAQADRRDALSVMFARLDERLAESDQLPPLEQ